jgi:hypothetical protein
MEALHGWQPDPWGIHEYRYFSVNGYATRLVRDGDQTSHDPPPTDSPSIDVGPREHTVSQRSSGPAQAPENQFNDGSPGLASRHPLEANTLEPRAHHSPASDSMRVASGWYDDPTKAGRLRYWDGLG